MAWVAPSTRSTGDLITASIWNADIVANTLSLKDPPSDVKDINEAANYTLASVSWTDIDATDLSIAITTTGGVVEVGFIGNFSYATTSRSGKVDVDIDGNRVGTDDGLALVRGVGTETAYASVGFVVRKEGLTAAAHTIKMQWKCENAADTLTLYAGAGTANLDTHPQFWAIER